MSGDMSEVDWLRCSQPRRMLNYLQGQVSARKLLLFSCASCRRVWEHITDHQCRQAVEVAESFADGLASEQELHEARKWARQACPAGNDANARAIRAAYAAVCGSQFAVNHQLLPKNTLKERKQQASLLLDIFGNPFQPVAINPSWLTWNSGTVVKIARSVYENRDFDHLAIVGDALEEAGCDNDAILVHCRSEREHVRGCWIIDLLLEMD
jgi:hypothetical protein